MGLCVQRDLVSGLSWLSWLKPQMWNHLYRGTMYLEGPRIWWDSVYRGTLYLEGRDHVWERVYEGTVCTEGQP